MFDDLPRSEQPVVKDLCKAILDAGYIVAIEDGEEIFECTTLEECDDNIGACDMEMISIWETESFVSVGWFFLVYNNGSEGDGMIVINDYGVSDLCDDIYDKLDDTYGDC